LQFCLIRYGYDRMPFCFQFIWFYFRLLLVKFLARNLTEEERKGYKEITWDSKEVCACYMVRFCPHDLFVNTRSDLGELKLNFYWILLSLRFCLVAEKTKEKKRILVTCDFCFPTLCCQQIKVLPLCLVDEKSEKMKWRIRIFRNNMGFTVLVFESWGF
jgi:hypothetical protein